IDMIPEVIEVGNIDAEGWNDDSKCGKKAKNEDFMTEENDMIIEYHSGSTSKMIGSYISPGKSDKISEVVKEGDEKEGSEGDMIYSTLIEIADLLNVSLGKNKEEINLNLDEIKRMENERSISKHITVSIDKMSDKEKIKRILQIFNRKEGANLIELITKYKAVNPQKNFTWISSPPKGRSGGLLVGFNTDIFDVISQDTSEFMISCLIHHKYKNISWNFINLDLSDRLYTCIDVWKEKVKRMKKTSILSEKDKEEKIHALYDNDRLVENEEEINKLATDFYKNLFGPSNNSTIHMKDMNMKKLSAEDRDFEEIHKVEFWILKDSIMWIMLWKLQSLDLFLKGKSKMGLFSKLILRRLMTNDWINFQKSECLARWISLEEDYCGMWLWKLEKEEGLQALIDKCELGFERRLVMLGVIGVAVASFTWKWLCGFKSFFYHGLKIFWLLTLFAFILLAVMIVDAGRIYPEFVFGTLTTTTGSYFKKGINYSYIADDLFRELIIHIVMILIMSIYIFTCLEACSINLTCHNHLHVWKLVLLITIEHAMFS
ncbi:hypothetical protein ACJX0J_024088, partial [Zea mays]